MATSASDLKVHRHGDGSITVAHIDNGWARYIYPSTGLSGGSGSWTEPYRAAEDLDERLAVELAWRRVRVQELRSLADGLEAEADALQQTVKVLGLGRAIR